MKKKFDELENSEGRFPLNLQFFADDGDGGADGEDGDGNGGADGEGNENEPTAEERLQQMMIDMEKLKRAQEKAASEAADYKKKYNATLSDAQKASQEKAEKEAEREEQFNKLLRENSVNKLAKNFLSLGYTAEMAEKAATAQYDNDTDTLFKIQNDHQSALVKEKEAEWLKSRPLPKTGTGEGEGEKDPFLAGFDS